jgi:hypothetical protein
MLALALLLSMAYCAFYYKRDMDIATFDCAAHGRCFFRKTG